MMTFWLRVKSKQALHRQLTTRRIVTDTSRSAVTDEGPRDTFCLFGNDLEMPTAELGRYKLEKLSLKVPMTTEHKELGAENRRKHSAMRCWKAVRFRAVSDWKKADDRVFVSAGP